LELDGEELAESLLERLENKFETNKALTAFEKISQVISLQA
jgi:ribosomal protein S17E